MIWSLYIATPPSAEKPWSILAYVDEASPGSLLKVDNTRKSHCWYWSFEELGAEFLSHEAGWFLGGLLRSTVCKKVAGGASSMFKHFLQGFFAEDVNFAHGVVCHGPRGSFLLRASLQTVLADEVAQCSLWRCKGSSGLKCCMLCANVVGARSGLDGGRFVTVECSDVSKFIHHSDATIWQTVDELAVLEYPGVRP